MSAQMNPGEISESDLWAMIEAAEEEVLSFGQWPYGTGQQRAYAHVIYWMSRNWMPKAKQPKVIKLTRADAEVRIRED